MTREQKLALIVGFSLILFVGVLISDHLSSARKTKIDKVSPEVAQAPLPVTPVPAPGAARESVVAAPQSVDPLQLIIGSPKPAETPPATTANAAPTNPQPEAAPLPRAPESAAPSRTIAADDRALADAVRRADGQMVRGNDGIMNISLPPAAQSKPANPTSPNPAPRTQAPIATNVGPLEPLKTHSVKSGENLFQITNKYYGNGNLWRELAKFNGLDKAGTLRLGAQLKIPSKETLLGRSVASQPSSPDLKLIKPAPESKPTPPKATPADRAKPKIELASYTIQKGDTLGQISLKTLGTSRRWQEIAELNHLDDEDTLTTGVVLKIPAKRS